MNAQRASRFSAGRCVVAACVEIAAGPGGVTAIRLAPVPPSVIVGDQLRDSTGAVVRLRAVAFDADGDTVPDAAFRFTALPLPRDTTAAEQRAPVTVDSLTGAVTASGTTTPLASRARLVARLGDRLQFIDTIAVVKRPTRLERAATNGDSLHVLAVPCNDSGTVERGDPLSGRAGRHVAVRQRDPARRAPHRRLGRHAPRRGAELLRALRHRVADVDPDGDARGGARRPAIAITRDVANDTARRTPTRPSRPASRRRCCASCRTGSGGCS